MQKEFKQEVIENQLVQNQMKLMLQTTNNMKNLLFKDSYKLLQNMSNTELR